MNKPPARVPNILGNAVKESWLPVSGAIPKVKTMAKTISPDVIEITAFVVAMAADEFTILTLLGI